MNKPNKKALSPPINANYEDLDEYYTLNDTQDLINAGILQEATQQEYEQIEKELGAKPKKAQVNFRLTEDELKILKKIADFKAIPYGTLVRSWIIERLRTEAKTFKQT